MENETTSLRVVNNMVRINRHPVDRLADIREQIKALQIFEKALRDQILAEGKKTIRGNDWTARVADGSKEFFDLKAIVAFFGIERLAAFKKQTRYQVVLLKKHEGAGDGKE